MDNQMERRWLSLFVENRAGVLARISGLFSGKAYNIHSLTVGETEDPTMSRMTICIDADEKTFEQVKKQLNRSVEVIKVIDYTDTSIRTKEIMFIKVKSLTEKQMAEIFQMAEVFQENGTTYILYSLKYSVKADNPEAVIVFEDTLKDGWLVINAVTTYVVQMDGGKFTSLGGYTTEFSADGNKEMYKIDFENWLAENILN